MEKTIAWLLLAASMTVAIGCSSVGPRKYVVFGEPQAEKVEIFEDYWSDFPFKPDDPNLPLRRGKGGVIRFFKKDNYNRAIMVDGDLTVNVYYSVDEGVILTEPDLQLVLDSKELNEKHRKFDKKTGYSYHVYLDLGVYDQPEEEITILSVFKDAKTGQATLSKEIRTTAMGTSPPVKKVKDEPLSEAEEIAKKVLGDQAGENPIAELQARYSIRNRAAQEELEARGNTRLRETIDLSDSRFQDINASGPVVGASYLQEQESRRQRAMEAVAQVNQERAERYHEKKKAMAQEYREEVAERNASVDSFQPTRNAVHGMDFNGMVDVYAQRQGQSKTQFENFAAQISERAARESAQTPMRDAENTSQSSATPSEETPLLKEYAPATTTQQPIVPFSSNSEMDKLNDFTPSAEAPTTEVYLKKPSPSPYY
ncbi:MAG: hypothetical protein Q4G03_06435 [Planctomycetia bacterium]|nr:hypothetical protein [Planctomycetia bacterium]